MLAQADRANRYLPPRTRAPWAPSRIRAVGLRARHFDQHHSLRAWQKDGRSAVEMRPIPQHRAVLPANRYHSA